jgi:hypothetical protein
MLQITPQMRILVAVEAVDFRKGIDSLAELCRAKLNADPFSGCLFVFRSRRATSIKVLVYDLCEVPRYVELASQALLSCSFEFRSASHNSRTLPQRGLASRPGRHGGPSHKEGLDAYVTVPQYAHPLHVATGAGRVS